MQQPVCERQDRVTPTCIVHAASCTLQPGISLSWCGEGLGAGKEVWIADPGRRQLLAVKRQPGGTEIWRFTTGKVCEEVTGPLKQGHC